MPLFQFDGIHFMLFGGERIIHYYGIVITTGAVLGAWMATGEVKRRGYSPEMVWDLLVYLMKNAGKALHHRAILQHVWGTEYGDEAEYLRVYVGKLRQKIEEDPNDPKIILTVHGTGYKLIN